MRFAVFQGYPEKYIIRMVYPGIGEAADFMRDLGRTAPWPVWVEELRDDFVPQEGSVLVDEVRRALEVL